jgi:hypothetical protein
MRVFSYLNVGLGLLNIFDGMVLHENWVTVLGLYCLAIGIFGLCVYPQRKRR